VILTHVVRDHRAIERAIARQRQNEDYRCQENEEENKESALQSSDPTRLPYLSILLAGAAKWVVGLVVVIGVGGAAKPAPLELTELTGHVVAPIQLLYLCVALWTKRYIPIILGPFIELLVLCLFASNFMTVPFIPALEADFCATELAADGRDVLAACSAEATAGWPRTPSDLRVFFQSDLLFETEVFTNKSRLALFFQNIHDVFLCYVVLAPYLQAPQSHLTSIDLEFQIVLNTSEAEAVVTIKVEEFFLFSNQVANPASSLSFEKILAGLIKNLQSTTKDFPAEWLDVYSLSFDT